MSLDGLGATPASRAQSQLDDLYGARGAEASPLDAFQAVSRKTRVPVNVLLALDEGRGDLKAAQSNAQRLSAAVADGKPIETAITELAGDEARGNAILQTAYRIADELDPPAPPAPDRGNDGKIGAGEALGGLGRDVATGAVRATGGAVEALGIAADEALRFGNDPATDGPTLARAAGRAAGDAVRGAGDAIADSRSEDYKTMRAGTQPGGDITDPSSWTLGEDPSLLGLMGVAAEGIGSMAPLVAAPSARVAAVFGGLMGAGEGAENGRKFVEDAASTLDENGRPEIEKLPEYQRLTKGGMDPAKAVEELSRQAENSAGFRQGLIASIGGAATNRIMRGAEGWLGQGGRLTRALKKGATGAAEEGVQEVAEGAASGFGIEAATGADVDLLADSFGNFVGGALAGGGMGAGAGALGRGEEPAQRPEPQPEYPPQPLGLPSPTDGGTIFAGAPQPGVPPSGPLGLPPPPDRLALPAPQPKGGPVVSAPRQITQDPTYRNPNFSFPALPAPDAPLGIAPEAATTGTGVVPAPRQITHNPDVQNPNWSFPTGSPATPSAGRPLGLPAPMIPADGSGADQAAAPVLSPPSLGAGAVAPELGIAPPAPTAPPAQAAGPVEAIAQQLQASMPAPTPEPAPRFPEQKPGSAIVIGTDDGAITNGVFMGETPTGAVVRVQGREIELTPEQFDRARDQAKINEAKLKEGPANVEPAGAEAGSDQRIDAPGMGDGRADGGQGIEAGGPALEAGIPGSDGLDRQPEPEQPGNGPAGSGDLGDVVLADGAGELGGELTPTDIAEQSNPEVLTVEPGSVAAAAQEAHPEPTEAQAAAGNYRKGHARWNGLNLTIENAKGSERRGKGPDGTEWSVTMPADYGYFRKSEGADGDHVDFYMGPDEASDQVFVIDQTDAETGAFDEHKIMLGFGSAANARAAHEAAFSDGKGAARMGGIVKMPVADLKEWLANGDTKKPVSRKLKAKAAAQPAPSNMQELHSAPVKSGPGFLKTLNTTKGAAKKGKLRAAATEDYFTPGNIVRSYGGGLDRIVSFDPETRAVTVQQVVKRDGEWVDDPTAPQRTHSTLPDDRALANGPVARAQAEPAAPAPQRRPFISYVGRAFGGINPGGKAAEELRHRGITARTAPGLFRRGGRRELDNIVADEHPDLIGAIPREGNTSYLSPQAIIDAIVDEVAGRPLAFGRHAEDQQAARDVQASRRASAVEDATPVEPGGVPDPERDIRDPMERLADIERMVDEDAAELGISLTADERAGIIAFIDKNGGDTADAIYDEAVRSESNAIREATDNGSAAGEVSDIPFGDEGEAGPAGPDAGADGGTSAQGDDPGGAVEGQRDDVRSAADDGGLDQSDGADSSLFGNEGAGVDPSVKPAGWNDYQQMSAHKDALTLALSKELRRVREAKSAAYAKGKRSTATMNKAALARRFGLNDHGMSPLDMLMGDLMLSALNRPSDYLAHTRQVVDAFLAGEGSSDSAPSSDPQVNPTGPDTIKNWRKSVPSTGSVRGWTVFDDTAVGGSWVLLSSGLDARPFASEADAREWAQANPESGFNGEAEATAPEQSAPATEPGADGLPQIIMPGMEGGEDQRQSSLTAKQRAEIEARQQQSKARRLDGNSGDAGPLFDEQDTLFQRDMSEPVATLTGDELGAWADMQVLQRKAKAWYRENLQGKSVVNRETGWEIGFTRAGAGKIGGKRLDYLLRAVPGLEAIVENASRIGEPEAPKINREGVRFVHRFVAPISLAGQEARIHIVIREMRDGQKFYDLNLGGDVGARASDDPRGAQQSRVLPEKTISADTLNMSLDDPSVNDRDGETLTPAQGRAVNAAANEALAAVGIGRAVSVDVGAATSGPNASYRRGVISILRPGGNWKHTLDHEIIHALRDPALWNRSHGLFSADEWRALVRAARRNDAIRRRVEAAYGDLDTAGQAEEMVAELYADWAQARRDAPAGPLRAALERIRSFFEAVASALRGEGFQSAATVMERIASGEVGGRGPDGPGGGRETAVKEQRGEVGISDIERVAKQVRDVLAGKKLSQPIALTRTPPVLEALIGKPVPIVISENVIWKANADKHALTASQIIAAIEGLNDPVMVFDSATTDQSLVALVDMESEARPVVVAVHYNKRVGRLEVAQVASIHPRSSDGHIIGWMQDGLTRYVNNEKAAAWSRSRGLQLPKDGTTKRRSMQKILRHRDVFKADDAKEQRDIGTSSEWRRGVSRVVAGKAKPSDSIVMGHPSAPFRAIGISDKPFVMRAARMVSVFADHAEVTPAIMQQFESTMENPPFILRSATREDSIVTVAFVTPDGSALIAAVALDRVDAANRKVHEITSVYMKRSEGWFNQQVEAERLVYDRDGKYAGGSANRPRSDSASGRLTKSGLTPPRKKKILTAADVFKSDDAKEQRDMAALKERLVNPKFRAVGLIGNLHWKRTPKEAAGWMSNLLTDAMGKDARFNALGLVPGRALFTELARSLPAAQDYLALKEKMDAMRNDWQVKSSAMVDSWTKTARKNPKANQALMEIMHESTLAGLDPSKEDGWHRPIDEEARKMLAGKPSPAQSEWAQITLAQAEERQEAWQELRDRFQKLPKPFRDLYVEIRNGYSDMADGMDNALIENIRAMSKVIVKKADREYRKEMDRIRDEGLTGDAKAVAVERANEKRTAAHARAARGTGSRLQQMRQTFESNRLSGPYFPLARFGNYFVTIRDENGKVTSFSRFETEREQQAWAEQAKKDRLGTVQAGVLGGDVNLREQVDPRFLADVEELMSEAGASREMMDQVWQRWLETLPDQSVRTSRIHRKGRAGFNKDAIRSFASSMFHGAHQMARLQYGAQMEETLAEAEEQASHRPDANRAGFVVREMRQRHAFTMSPTNNPWVTKATSLAFVWYLGVSPAAAMVNLSQTTVVGIPMMAARFRKGGAAGAMKELSRASADFMRGRGAVSKKIGGISVSTGTWTVENAPNLSVEERQAMEQGYQRGVIDKTQAHDLASVADSGVEYNPTREKVMRVIGWGFHHAERFNREVTYLASYRMARAEGADHETAIESAANMTWRVHFDYSNSSRPRAMTGDAAKVFTIFKNFQVNMLFRLFRDAHQSLHAADAETKREARLQLAGVTLSLMAHAGIRGVWGYALLTTLLSWFMPGADDGDDIDEWLQDALLMEGDGVGTAAWNFIMAMALNGVPGHLAGIDLTNRIGMPELLIRSSQRDLEGKDQWYYLLEQLAGPLAAIAGNAVVNGPTVAGQAANLVADRDNFDGDEMTRAVEKVVPTFVRNVIKTGRYAADGVTTWNGDPVVDDLNPYQLLMQLQGFTPAEVAEQYQINNRLKNRERRITDKRQDIMRQIGDAVREGNPIPESAMRKMRGFNREYPGWPITSDSIRQSVRSRQRASERNEGGVSINKKLDAPLRESLAPTIY